MAIDWTRFTHTATDGLSNIWTYRTDTIGEDVALLEVSLPTLPPHEIIKAKSRIDVIFTTPIQEIRHVLDGIADSVLNEDA